MGKSIDPMFQEKAGSGSRAHSRRSSASMSLQPVIPWRVALQQGPPPLHRPASECDKVVLPVNRYRDNGNIADPVNFNRLPDPLAAQTEKQNFHLKIRENCPNNRDHRIMAAAVFRNIRRCISFLVNFLCEFAWVVPSNR
jgi:hypothetical protein